MCILKRCYSESRFTFSSVD